MWAIYLLCWISFLTKCADFLIWSFVNKSKIFYELLIYYYLCSINLQAMDKRLEEIQHRLNNKTLEELAHEIVSIRDTMDVVTNKWKVEILTSILRGNLRFRDLLAINPGLTDKVLSNRLAQMVDDKLIGRVELYGYPPKVEYRITEHGLSLFQVIDTMKEWGDKHRRLMLGNY